jgi:hypothetical protein
MKYYAEGIRKTQKELGLEVDSWILVCIIGDGDILLRVASEVDMFYLPLL